MSKKKVMALLVAGIMAATTVSVPVFAEEAETETTEETEETEETAETEEGGEASETPLVVGQTNFSEKFSGMFAEAVPDQQIADLVGAYLFDNDRSGAVVYNGIEGEDNEYNGTTYHYTGLSDVTVTQNEDTTVYNFKLREDAKFSDGEPVTADDLIFTLYVYSDTDYNGNATLYSTNIKGMQNYRLNSTAADSVSEEDIAATLEEMPEELAQQVKDTLIMPLLDSEYSWAEEAWEEYKDSFGVNSGAEFFAALYSTDENYSVEGKEQDAIVSEIAEQYGTDYKTLAANYGDEAYFDEDVTSLAQSYLVDQKTAAGEGEEVANIEGIKKLGDYEVEVTTDGFSATTIYNLGVIVEPLHYYGDESLYDYDNNQFGFTRGDLSAVRDKSNQPMGAGPYKFVKYENKTVYMEANENYYKGEPKIKYLQWRETTDADKIAGVEQGTIDLTDPSGSKDAFDQIKGINGNDDINGEKIMTNAVDNLGYGYIGICADNVKVGDDGGSAESKALRKAIATVLSVYRDVSIDSYYGDAASVINYPISNTSWAAPQKSDADYQVAFSVDKDGNPIYTDEMTDEEKFDAALNAALGYFEAAGYTVEDGKLTAAPEGAKLSYEIVIGADGQGNHPSFAIMTDAKAALEKIGFTLEINDVTDANIMWDALNAGTAELWAAAWQATVDPDMYQIYHSDSVKSNYYHIYDDALDQAIIDARSSSDQDYRKSVYKQCLDIIVDWAVEIPVYQRQNCIIYSPERINADTFTKDVTTFYNWYKDIELLEMN